MTMTPSFNPRPKPLGGNAPVSQPPAVQVKIGEKRKTESGKEYPSALDYFVLDEKSSLFEAFNQKFNRPSELKIVFPFNAAEKCCSVMYLWRDGAGRKTAYSDGEKFFAWESKMVNGKDLGDFVPVNSNDARVPPEKAITECTLTFLIPDFNVMATLYRLTTQAQKTSIPNIVNTFDMVQRSATSVIGVPFILSVMKAKGNTPGGRVYPILNLQCLFTWQDLNILGQYHANGNELSYIIGKGGIIDIEKLHTWAKEYVEAQRLDARRAESSTPSPAPPPVQLKTQPQIKQTLKQPIMPEDLPDSKTNAVPKKLF